MQVSTRCFSDVSAAQSPSSARGDDGQTSVIVAGRGKIRAQWMKISCQHLLGMSNQFHDAAARAQIPEMTDTPQIAVHISQPTPPHPNAMSTLTGV